MPRSKGERLRAPLGPGSGGRGAAALAATLISITIALSGPRVALADAYCGAGKHVGAENDGAGLSWICVPDRSRSISIPTIGSGGGTAPGLAGAAAGLEGLAALLDIANALGSMIAPTDAAGPITTEDPSVADTRSRDLNRQAIAAMQAGRFDLAAELFNKAGMEALQAHNFDDSRANMRNAKLANAENMLKQGYLAEQRGDLANASRLYMQGKQAADGAGAGDLAAKLATYNDQLMARGGIKAGVTPTQSSCATINGQFMCR